jgi:hypothetical protein
MKNVQAKCIPYLPGKFSKLCNNTKKLLFKNETEFLAPK